MPELPEVEATRENLQRWSAGRRVLRVERRDRALDEALERLVGATIAGWSRRGKALVAVTDLPDGAVLHVHLGMTGRWVRDPEPERAHQRLVIELAGPGPRWLAYADVRRLGTARLVADEAEAFEGLGIDARDARPGAEVLARVLGDEARRSEARLKARLLDQKRLAGLGNIAVSECCFFAGVHPHERVRALGMKAWARLAAGIAEHLERTLATTLGRDEIAYVSEGGDNPFVVYAREGEPCPRCATPIGRAVAGGRVSFFCVRCQPEVSG